MPRTFMLLGSLLPVLLAGRGAARENAEPPAAKVELVTIDADRTIETDLVVKVGQKLVIRAGVILKFAETAGIICEGIIEARGTGEKPIVFTAQDAARGWKNVCLGGPGKEGSVLEHCRFSLGRGRLARFKQATLEFEKFVAPGDGEGLDINCGGALFIYGPGKVEIRCCRFESNAAYWGGAINCWGKAGPAITGCLFANNRGEEDAGAVHCVALSSPAIAGNCFTGNSAKYGGAIHCLHGSSPAIRDNHIAGNTATGNSSAISCFNKACPEITGNYIAGNLADRENGMAIETVVHSKPVLKGNYIGENRSKSGLGKGLRANDSFRGQKDESTCTEESSATKEEVLKLLKEKGVLDLFPKNPQDGDKDKQELAK